MMKKILCAAICSMLLMMLASTALANPKHVSADGLYAMVDAANAQIEALVEEAIATPENDVKDLQQQIKKIVHDVESYAKKLDAEIGCDMVEYEIDGQTVMIDPLYVINIRQ